MTAKEAMRILALERDDWETSHCTPSYRKEAFDMAINALTAEDKKRTENAQKTHACDLIDRQAAQTELMMKCERYTLARESYGMGHVEWSDELIDLSDAMDAIRDLPSAQPQYTELTPEEAASEIASGSIMSASYWLDNMIRLKQMGYAICRKKG